MNQLDNQLLDIDHNRQQARQQRQLEHHHNIQLNFHN
jgi:hypothetical protein